ncbi:LOW QUALITY PROTEIN: nuclear envelope pore membrane protein POM 121 [Salarias fasciatus]|uniref:LOW QUALITY PROTEIN: nuclear envelope pore membrane protein POM 121 n=1 Tax=Salarias fasciatus TaxID=181472 RepID=UPI001176E2BD|nr:LOW QUALITY PROTEIN: nuclear envelope pore membrane protein POM 121-like [Salarias fasciatus]
MRVVRRRAAAMSPKEKRLLLLAALTLFFLTFYYAPSFLYATLILAACCAACFYHSREPLPARLGQKPRAGLSVPAALRRWLWGSGVSGAPVAAAGRTKSGANRAELREAGGLSRNRGGIHRREVQPGGSFYFSPQDFLMGSYIGKHDSPTAETGRPRAVRNPREQLRERLSRPNHAVPTPIRRLSFAGEPVGTVGRFTITPQRHYPLQQPGVSSVGVLPPVKWDGFSKKNVLSPRNSSAALSPVTVKIARPDHSTPSMEHLSCAGLSRPPADPCSRESVLRVLRESRKRDVEEEDRSFVADQRSKRRRNDSGGSAHSAFEPLLPNGTPSQLVPKPGSLKRGLASLADESIMKRSRTSSISSGSGAHAPRGTLGSRRNAIQSSYSSSLGLGQWKRPSAPSSPLSSPGSSRCQTPEGSSKRPREDDGQSPSSASSVRSDHTASDKAPTTSKVTPAPSVPVLTSSASAGSGGKRKRKIPLVSSLRDDQISLPPPPELGYTITVKDLDEEKKAGISKIQKVLETPAPEPEKPASPPATTSTPAAASTTAAAAAASSSSITLSSLLAAPLPTNSSSTIPVINLDPSPGSSSSSAAANPLLEALKMKIIPPASSTPSTSTTAVSASTTPAPPSSSALNPSTASEPPQPPPAGAEKPSAFAQVLSQASKAAASSSSPAAAGGSLFGITPQISAAAASSASNPVTASASASSTNPLLPSGFKPIFSVNTTSSSSATSTSESTTAAPTFKPVFGDAPAAAAFGQPSSITSTDAATTVPSSTAASMFGGSTSSSTAAPSPFAGLTNPLGATPSAASAAITQPTAAPTVKSLFGAWSAPSSTSSSSAASVQAPNAGSTFQFGAASTTTTSSLAPAAAAPTAAAAPAPAAAAATSSSQAPFTFGATQPDPQAAAQKVFAFGQTAPAANTTTASFGGFAMASSTSTAAATATQSTIAFGKMPFDAPAASSTFGSAAAPQKPFTFGNSGAASTPAPNPAPGAAPTPFTFGSTAATMATTFGTPAKPTFGAASTGFAFGGTTAPSAAPAAPPSFGAATQAQSAPSSTFTFGGAAPQPNPAGPAQPATAGFNFGGSGGMAVPQFGTPVSNSPAPQMGSFNFGAAAADKPAFGTPTPSFGQPAALGPSPFGSPGTPIQGFSAGPFGPPATPSFSIGAGSKSSGRSRRGHRLLNKKK